MIFDFQHQELFNVENRILLILWGAKVKNYFIFLKIIWKTSYFLNIYRHIIQFFHIIIIA